MAKTVKSPRISINKLAEYLEADSTRRRQIIFDAKYPQDFKGARYLAAKDIILPYLIVHRNTVLLRQQIDKFSKKKATTPWQVQDRDNSITILESLLITDLSILKNCDLVECNSPNRLLMIKGVGISVNPDIIVTKTIKGIINKGAIKLHTSKTYPLKEEGQKIVAGVLHNYVNTHILKTGEVANPKLSVSFDMFTGKLEPSPASFKTRMTKLEASCEEIALRWPTL